MSHTRTKHTALLRLFALVVLVLGIGAIAFETPVIKSTAAAKDNGHGKAKAERRDDDDDDNEGPGNAGQDAKKDPKEKKPKKPKKEKDDAQSAPEPVQVVVVEPTTSYRVTVGCHADAEREETTCIFAGVALADGGEVGGLAVPEATVCAPVVAGDYALSDGESTGNAVTIAGDRARTGWYAFGSGYRGPAFVSGGQPDVLSLVLAGTVETGGSATYWLQTDDGVAAATGPGLRCAPTAATTAAAPNDQPGAIVVQTFTCPFETAPGDAATLDWFAECTQPAPDTTFDLTALDGETTGSPQAATAGTDGVLRVEDLTPGDYRLIQAGTNWCHAESDRVDDQGNIVVTAGERASVWIFNCVAAADSALIPK